MATAQFTRELSARYYHWAERPIWLTIILRALKWAVIAGSLILVFIFAVMVIAAFVSGV